jgi:hypothetical protein
MNAVTLCSLLTLAGRSATEPKIASRYFTIFRCDQDCPCLPQGLCLTWSARSIVPSPFPIGGSGGPGAEAVLLASGPLVRLAGVQHQCRHQSAKRCFCFEVDGKEMFAHAYASSRSTSISCGSLWRSCAASSTDRSVGGFLNGAGSMATSETVAISRPCSSAITKAEKVF